MTSVFSRDEDTNASGDESFCASACPWVQLANVFVVYILVAPIAQLWYIAAHDASTGATDPALQEVHVMQEHRQDELHNAGQSMYDAGRLLSGSGKSVSSPPMQRTA